MSRQAFTPMIEALETRTLFATSWGATAQLVQQDDAASRYSAITGKGVTVAVIDSGIDYTQSALGGAFGSGHKVIGGYDFVDDDSDPMDTDGHGTEVAGVIAASRFTYQGKTYQGVAPDAKLVALRVTHGQDGAQDSTIEQALNWIITNFAKYAIKVVNISLGSGSYSSDHTNSTLSDEFQELADLGIAVFAASGNEGTSGIAYPAADPNVFSVGSVNSSDTISSFTQIGSELDLLAPGEGVATTRRGGGYTAVDGTSFASPYAAGAAALIEQLNPGVTPNSLLSVLRASGASNRDGDTESGPTTGALYPRLDIYNALALTNRRKTPRGVTVGINSGAGDIVYDQQGILHLAYYDAATRSILYATRDTNGRWSRTQVVDTSGDDVGRQLSIAIDSTGKPGIAYYDTTNADLKYAHFTGRGWDVRTMDRVRNVGEFPSMAYDWDGDPVIAYYRKTGGYLRMLAIGADGTWTRTDVDGGVTNDGNVGQWADVSISQTSGIIAIAYEDITHGSLKYARYANGQWTIFTVDALDAGGAAYIDLNIHNNQAFISYQDLGNGDLKFAKRENAQWHTETIYTPGNTGSFSSLVFDDEDIAHIAFYSKSKAATYEAVGSFSSWSVTPITAGGSYLSAAATDDGNVIAYVALDKTRHNLQFGLLSSD
jgi:subtilisin family serine protease